MLLQLTDQKYFLRECTFKVYVSLTMRVTEILKDRC